MSENASIFACGGNGGRQGSAALVVLSRQGRRLWAGVLPRAKRTARMRCDGCIGFFGDSYETQRDEPAPADLGDAIDAVDADSRDRLEVKPHLQMAEETPEVG